MQAGVAGPRVIGVTRMAVVAAFVTAGGLFPGDAHAQFSSGAQIQDIVPDARSQGMGRAFTAVAQGPWTAWWNPGALPLQRDLSVGYSYAQLVPGRGRDVWIRSAAAARARNGIGCGVHFARLDYGKFTVTGPLGNETGQVEPYETAIHLAAGVDLGRLIAGPTSPVAFGIGAAVKRLHLDYGRIGGIESEVDVVATAHDVDVGLLAQWRVPIRSAGEEVGRVTASGGLHLRNQLGHEFEFEGTDQPGRLGHFRRWGTSVAVGFGRHAKFGTLAELTVAYDYAPRPGSLRRGREIRNFGLEVGVLRMLYYRYGKITDRTGDIVDDTRSFGFGPDVFLDGNLKSLRLRYDYASIPQASGLDRVKQHTFSAGFGL